MNDRKLLEMAAKAAGHTVDGLAREHCAYLPNDAIHLCVRNEQGGHTVWNPLTDDGDLMRLARRLGISIDYADKSAWTRLPLGGLIQDYWGGDWGDEAHAIVRVAAEIGKAKP